MDEAKRTVFRPVSIIKIISPSIFLATWSPEDKFWSAQKFNEFDKELNNYCCAVVNTTTPRFLPESKQIVAIRHPRSRHYHRARVECVASRIHGFEVLVFVIDTAEELVVQLEWVRVLPQRFLKYPFRCFELHLPVVPQSIALRGDLSVTIKENSKWDSAAEKFATRLIRDHGGAEVEILKEIDDSKAFVKLYLSMGPGKSKLCYNDALIKQNYAMAKELDPLHDSCGNENLPNTTPNQGGIDISSRSSRITGISEDEIYELQREAVRRCHRLNEEVNLQYGYADEACAVSNVDNSAAERLEISVSRGTLGKNETLKCLGETDNKFGGNGGDVQQNLRELSAIRMPGNTAQPCEIPSDRELSSAMSTQSADSSEGVGKETTLLSKFARGRGKALLEKQQRLSSALEEVKDVRMSCSSQARELLHQQSRKTISSRSSPKSVEGREILTPECASIVRDNRQQSPLKYFRPVVCGTSSEDRRSLTGSKYTPFEKTARIQDIIPQKQPLQSSSREQFNEHCQTEHVTRISDQNSAADVLEQVPFPHLSCIIKAVECCKKDDLQKNVTSTSSTRVPVDSFVKPLPVANKNHNSHQASNSVQGAHGRGSQLVTNSHQVPDSIKVPQTRTTRPFSYCLNVSQHNDSLDIVDQSADVRKILVCGQVTARPFKTIGEGHFGGLIKSKLDEMGIHYPSTIQSYMWPAIIRGLNVAVISGPRSGQTVGYLLPLISRIKEGRMYKDLPKNNEPIALILCATWSKAVIAYETGLKITQGHSAVKLLLLHGGSDDKKQTVSLVNGCDILVATPCALLRVLNSQNGITPTGFSRLCHLVFDDADILTDTFKEQIKQLLSVYTRSAKTHHRNVKELQIMTFSNKWTAELKDLIKSVVSSPLLLCSALCESMVFAGISAIVHMFKQDEQKQKLYDEIIKPYLDSKKGKMVICTEKIKCAKELHLFLKTFPLCKEVLVVHHKMDMPELIGAKNLWSNLNSILIVTDKALEMLGIEDANCLIHYDIPEFDKGKFGRRFISLLKHMRADNYIYKDVVTKHSQCVTHLIVTDRGFRQAYPLLVLLQRLSCPVPESLRALALGYYERKEEKKSPISLCYHLKAFGTCRNPNWCTDRHLLLPAADAPSSWLLRGGQVRFEVTCVRNAAHSFGRIAGFKGHDGTWTKLDTIFQSLVTDMALYYANATNCTPISSPTVGEMGAIAINAVFYRVSVLYKDYVRPKDKIREIQVFFIDEGSFMYVEESQVLNLPEEFARIPRQAYEIFLCNVGPLDKDSDWTPQASQFVESLIMNKELTGKIQLSLGYTLWLHPLARMTKLNLCNDYVREFELHSELIAKGYAMEIPNHITDLATFCQTTFDLPPPIEMNNTSAETCPSDDGSIKNVSFAFLPIEEFVDVYVSYIIHPGKFYLQRSSSFDCLDSLMEDLQTHVKQCVYKGLSEVKEGLLCLAPMKGSQDYYRARILKTPNATGNPVTTNECITTFFVDFGYSYEVEARDLVSLPNKFLWKLPLQAIECSLFGIKPMEDDGWSDEASKYMHDVCLPSDSGQPLMTVKAMKKMDKNTELFGNSYSIQLFDVNYDIADELYFKGLARETDDDASCSNEDELNLSNSPTGITDVLHEDEETIHMDVSQDSASSVPNAIESCKNNEQIERIPLIEWAQRVDKLFLKFIIPEVKNHSIKINGTTLNYRATSKGTPYAVELQLSDNVNKEDIQMEPYGPHVRVTLKKTTPKRWQKLTANKEKLPYVSVDFDAWVDSSDEENEIMLESWQSSRMTVDSSKGNPLETAALAPDTKHVIRNSDIDDTSSEDESGHEENGADDDSFL